MDTMTAILWMRKRAMQNASAGKVRGSESPNKYDAKTWFYIACHSTFEANYVTELGWQFKAKHDLLRSAQH